MVLGVRYRESLGTTDKREALGIKEARLGDSAGQGRNYRG